MTKTHLKQQVTTSHRALGQRTLRSLRFSVAVVNAGEAAERLGATLDSITRGAEQPCERIIVGFREAQQAGPVLDAGERVRQVTSTGPEDTLATLLNLAASQAIGQHLLFLPAGLKLRRGWETEYLRSLSAGPCVVGTRWLCFHQGTLAHISPETPDSFLDWHGLALPRRAFENLGGFDDRFGDQGLAMDLCWRARDKRIALRVVSHRAHGNAQPKLPLIHEATLRRDLVNLHRKFPGHLELPEDILQEAQQQDDENRTKDNRESSESVEPLPAWLRSPHRQRPVRDGERILIHREIGMGDILISLTAAQAFKDQNPNCHITFSTAVRYTALPGHSPYVDEVLTPDQVRAGRFDREVDFEGREKFDFVSGEGRKERLDLVAELVGYAPKIRRPIYQVTRTERQVMESRLWEWGVARDAEKVGVILSASSPYRSRSPEASTELVKALLEDRSRAHIFLIDNDESYFGRMDLSEHPRLTNLCGKLDLAQLAALVEQLDLLLTPDTGPMHLAAGLGIPQIAFFTEIHPQVRVTHYPHVVAKARGELCIDWPCGYGGHCKVNQKCVNALTYQELRADVESLLRVSHERKALQHRSNTDELSRRRSATQASRVLLERHGGLGDVLFALTVTQTLKRLNPEAEIDFVTSPEHAEWVRWFPFLNEVTSHRPGRHYGLSVNLQDIETMDGIDRIEVMAAKLGLLARPGGGSPYLTDLGELVQMPDVPQELKLNLEARVQEETARLHSEVSLPLLSFAPLCVNRKPDRSWPLKQVEDFLTLATERFRVLLLDGARIDEITDRPNLLRFDGATSAAEAIALLSLCDRFVGMDSGLLYAALSLRLPSVGLFTHIEPLSRLTRARNYVAVRPTGLDCIPCGDYDGDLSFAEIRDHEIQGLPSCIGTSSAFSCVRAIAASAAWKAARQVGVGEGQVWTVPVAGGQLHRPPRTRPRLTFVVPWLHPGGGERHLQYLCEGLDLEYDVDLIVTDPERSHSFESVFHRWPVHDLDGDYRTRARRLAAHFDGRKPKATVFYNNSLTLDALERSNHRPDKLLAIVHTQFEHETALTSHPMSFLVDRFVCVSETVKEVLQSRAEIAADRLMVIRNGVELERFEGTPSARRALGYNTDDFVLGNVGRIASEKNLSILLETAALMPERVKVLFVGWGDEVDLCRSLARELQIEHRFRIVDPTPHVGPYLSAMDVFALPTDIEGSVPYAIMEAMAAGTPVLCTPVTDIPRLFRDGESILFVEKSAQSIADKIQLLMNDAELGRRITEGATSVLRDYLSADDMLDGYMTLLDPVR